MRLSTALFLGTAMLAMSSGANATLMAGLGGGSGTFLTLSSAGLNGGSVATLTGGTIYTSDEPFADIPKGGLFGGTFLAAGPLAGQPATLTFTTPTSYLSFLWGSPDTYNLLTVTTNAATYTYTAASLGFPVTNGDQSFSQYVQFVGSAGEAIRSISLTNNPARDAFEVANFSISTAVPEPMSWALMTSGFALLGAALRRRPRTAVRFA